MKPLYNNTTIHIEITNACDLECANCTRFIGHHKKTFFMDITTVEKSLKSLEGFEGQIGIMGGEPTIHPKFKDICEILIEYVPDKKRRGLWTNGKRWDKHFDIIKKTFSSSNIIYNDHKDQEVGWHQPLLIAAKDVIKDKKLMWELIDNCWIQEQWSASITPKGAFFCEVAAAQDHLFNGPGGYPIEKDWWRKEPSDFMDQVKRYCENCSAAIPMNKYRAGTSSKDDREKDLISKSNEEKLEINKSPRYKRGKVDLFDKQISKDDINKAKNTKPWSHRTYKMAGPDILICDDQVITGLQNVKQFRKERAEAIAKGQINEWEKKLDSAKKLTDRAKLSDTYEEKIEEQIKDYDKSRV